MLNFRNALILGSSLALGACAADSNDTGGSSGTGDDPTATTGMTMTTAASMTMTSTTVDTDTASTGADTTGGMMGACYGIGGPNAEGDACTANADCESGVCTIFTDVPLNDDAVCAPTPPMTEAGCNTRITGTVFDFSTLAPSGGATMKVAAALNAITNPAGADALAMATSGADGRLDVTTDVPISAAIAIIALVEGPGAYLTATGLASPAEGSEYAVGNGIHDLWSVPTGPLDAWSAALATDVDVAAELLPLGDAGGIVGLVRDAAGLPIAGATVAPVDAGSGTIIRYVAADNTIVADATTETGIFIIMGAQQTGEDFEASVGGAVVASARAGTANNVVFTMILNAE